jgi:methionine-rich copper-binding protein CopC
MEISMRKLPLLAAALCALAFADVAEAHTRVVTSAPAANATVPSMRTISISFNERTVPAFSGAEVVMTAMPGMASHSRMKLNGMTMSWSADGKTLTLTAGRPFPKGTYQVTWHAAGTDTHRMQGSYTFTVK